MRAIATTAVLAAALLAPATAGAARPWGAAETVSRTAGPVPTVARGIGQPRAAIDARGTAVLVWTGPSRSAREGAFGARRASARGFGMPFALRVQDHYLGDAAVQASAAGDLPMAWRRFLVSNHRIESTTMRRSGGRTGGPISLSGPGSSAYDPEFAAVAAGTLPAAPVLTWWRRETDRVQLSRAVDGRLLASRTTTVPGAIGARYVQRPDGLLVAASAEGGRVVAVDADAADAFGAPVVVASGAARFADADIAVAPDGAVAVTWRESGAGASRVRVALRPAAATVFGDPVTVSGDDDGAQQPRVAITSDGTVRVAYVAGVREGGAIRSVGPLRLATVGGAPQTLTGPGEHVRTFDVGADGRGGVTLAWQRRRRVPGIPAGAIVARAVTRGGAPGRARRLTSGPERGVSLDLAVGPRGDAVVVWTNVSGTRLRAAYRPAG